MPQSKNNRFDMIKWLENELITVSKKIENIELSSYEQTASEKWNENDSSRGTNLIWMSNLLCGTGWLVG